MKSKILLVAVAILAMGAFAFTLKKESERTANENAVKELVMNAYVNGAFNELDAESMSKGFHEDFAIFSAKGEEISKYKIADWVDGVKKRREADYNPKDVKNVWEPTFASIDVTGGAATVKIELRNQGKHVYTDYLSLLKFESGWRIVAKVYHKH